MGTGLTFDEYIELTAMPLAGADPVFVQVVEEERERMFPMPLVVAANHLRVSRLRLPAGVARVADSEGIVTPANPDAWTDQETQDPGNSRQGEGICQDS